MRRGPESFSHDELVEKGGRLSDYLTGRADLLRFLFGEKLPEFLRYKLSEVDMAALHASAEVSIDRFIAEEV